MITSCLFDDAGSVCYSLQNMQRFYFAVRGGKRQFRLAETCQPGDSTPRFLAAQRSAVSSRREEIAQRKPLGMVSSGLLRKQRGAAPLAPRAARYRRLYRLGVLRTFERSVVEGTTNLADPTRRKANFLWKFLCAGTAFSAMRPPPPSQPTRKDFCRAKMPCGGRDCQICCSAGRSLVIL